LLSQERKAGKALFLTPEGVPNALATTISTTVSSHAGKPVLTIDEPKAAPLTGKAGRLMSKEDQERVKAAIAKATSMEEIRRLERSLREGYLPEMESVGA
jgi:U2 small nuclear ribonucleoprotein A'